MSFATEMKKELLSLPIKMNCCRKAYMLGLLYNSAHIEGIRMSAAFGMRESAERAAELLGELSEPTVTERAYAGRRIYELNFASKAFANFDLKVSRGEDIAEAAKFRCDDCKGAFLAGVLISSATVNDPMKGYHLEISLGEHNKKRIEPLRRVLEENALSAKYAERQKKVSLYFKNNTAIADIISHAGAMKTSFDVANACIARDIRNRENRATNCETRNISRSVDARIRQLAAVETLVEKHKLDSLPQQLRETALLRLEYDEATLSELALLHEPPISKSGLNHRLERICQAAEELDD
ncbi:MAG: DNA-binding protein WhiA [Clostridia bacterium]|nr:DNA-binding protein WhiA [Clostridia bacterium]